jgi:hypothetical protein
VITFILYQTEKFSLQLNRAICAKHFLVSRFVSVLFNITLQLRNFADHPPMEGEAFDDIADGFRDLILPGLYTMI